MRTRHSVVLLLPWLVALAVSPAVGASPRMAARAGAPGSDFSGELVGSPATPHAFGDDAIHDTRLANGLRLLVSPSPTATATAVVLTFRVGSRDETRDQNGFAHLFEHMMFQGSAHAPKGEHMRLITGVGGEMNAMTTYDMTQYYDLVPPEHLALALWLEADRMRSLTLTEETLRNQVAAVREELRQRVENATYGPAMLRFQALLFSSWANAHPTIGAHEAIEAATVAMARGFFHRHYGPGNATLVISGPVDVDEVEELVEHYFGDLRGEAPPPRPDNAEPDGSAAQVVRETDRHARTPALLIGWQSPPRDSPDYYAMGVLAELLAGSESSRLYRRLVKTERVAAGVWASQAGRLGPDMFDVTALLTGGALDATRQAIGEEVERLRTELVPDAELQKVRTGREASFLFGLRTTLGRARLLSRLAQVYPGTPSISAELGRYLAVTAEDVRRVARAWLTPEHRVTLEIVPAAQGSES